MYADSYLSQAYFYLGDTAHAFGLLDSLAASSSGPAVARARSASASFAAAGGDRARAERLIAEVLRDGYMDHHVAYSLGVAYAQLGRMAEADRWLERAVSKASPATLGTSTTRCWRRPRQSAVQGIPGPAAGPMGGGEGALHLS